ADVDRTAPAPRVAGAPGRGPGGLDRSRARGRARRLAQAVPVRDDRLCRPPGLDRGDRRRSLPALRAARLGAVAREPGVRLLSAVCGVGAAGAPPPQAPRLVGEPAGTRASMGPQRGAPDRPVVIDPL